MLYAHASCILPPRDQPGLRPRPSQAHGDRIIWVNPPAFPLETDEMDGCSATAVPAGAAPGLRQRGRSRLRHDQDLGQHHARLLWRLLLLLHHRHEGRIIQSCSPILKEIEEIRDKVPGFTGVISDLGGPKPTCTSLRCKSLHPNLSPRLCVWPDHLPAHGHGTTARPSTSIASTRPGIKKILIASGVLRHRGGRSALQY